MIQKKEIIDIVSDNNNINNILNNKNLRHDEVNKMAISQIRIIMQEYIAFALNELKLSDDEIKRYFNETLSEKANIVAAIIKFELTYCDNIINDDESKNNLQIWLEKNKLMKLLPILNENNIIILSDLTDLLKHESD
eukprot:416026_1